MAALMPKPRGKKSGEGRLLNRARLRHELLHEANLFVVGERIGQSPANAGEDGAVVTAKILEQPAYGFGYNAQTGEYGDLTSQGVIDPTKVVRNALQGAASIAGLLITTEAMVAELPKKEAAHPPMPGGMRGMDY